MKNASFQNLNILLRLLLALVIFAILLLTSSQVSIPSNGSLYDFEDSKSKKIQISEKTMSHFDRQLDIALNSAANNKKVILYWCPMGDCRKNRNMRRECGSCELSSNASKINDKSTAAVVFKYEYVTPHLMPPKSLRRQDQLYIWLCQESPANLVNNRHKTFVYEDSVEFNATMTYRRDSDIFQPYGPIISKLKDTNLTAIMAQKTKAGIAIVSNCNLTPGAQIRRPYLRKIAEKFPVDLFGRCFKSLNIPKGDDETLRKMLLQYKFFFAFENSYHCRDYITEKFHLRALGANALPVVWGAPREDYEAVVPPEAFIHVDDYPNIDALVEYLDYLNKNDSAYLEHFRWKKSYVKNWLINRTSSFCQLCRMVNGINVDDIHRSDYDPSSPMRPMFTSSVAQRTISSLKRWIWNDDADCFRKKLKLTTHGKVIPTF